MGFCSHNDGEGRVWYDPESTPYLWWRYRVLGDVTAKAQLDQLILIKRRSGITHFLVDCPDGNKYVAPGLDWIQSLPNWMDDPDAHFFPLCQYLREAGFTLVWFIYGGGDDDIPRIYNGDLAKWVGRWNSFPWAQTSIRSWAYETFGRNGNNPAPFTARVNSDAWLACAVGLPTTSALLGHMQPCYRLTWYPNPMEPDCPIPISDTGEIEAWYTAGGRYVLYFGAQFTDGDVTRRDIYLPEYQQDQDRCLPKGTLLPNGHTTIGPDWFDNPSKREAGRMIFCALEPGVPYLKSRNAISDATIQTISADMTSLGIVDQGCLPAA